MNSVPSSGHSLSSSGSSSSNARELELLRQVAGGDRTAFKELYLIYHRRLARFLMRMTSRHDLIEEVINDTLWTVWLKAGDFRGDSLVSTWIVGITYRRALKALRRHGAARPMLVEEVAVAPDAVPSMVYLVILDRETNEMYKSNRIPFPKRCLRPRDLTNRRGARSLVRLANRCATTSLGGSSHASRGCRATSLGSDYPVEAATSSSTRQSRKSK